MTPAIPNGYHGDEEDVHPEPLKFPWSREEITGPANPMKINFQHLCRG